MLLPVESTYKGYNVSFIMTLLKMVRHTNTEVEEQLVLVHQVL